MLLVLVELNKFDNLWSEAIAFGLGERGREKEREGGARIEENALSLWFRCGKRQVYSKANVLRVSLLTFCALQLWVTAILPREASRESKVV